MLSTFINKMWLMTLRRSFLFLLMTDFLLAADTFMWTFPPPAWTPTDGNDVRTFNFTVLNGSTNVALTWNYTLASGEILALTAWKIDENDLGILTIVPTATVYGPYTDRFIISTSEVATVIIKNVSDINDATFECKVTTSKGAWKYKISLEITAPPVISGILGEPTVNDSDLLNLTCKADGKPTPNIAWTRVSDNSSVTVPFTITGKQDEGFYRCTADNGIGNPARRDVYVTVQNYRPINTSLDTSLINNTVTVNGAITMTCRAHANPPAKYQFFKNLVSLKNDTNGSDVSVITIPVSERIKQVNYSCTPFNDFGAGPTEVTKVTVLYAPGRANLTTVPSNRTLLRDSNMTLNCVTDASPEAEYHFYFNGTSIGNSTSGVFSVTVVTDGEYACVPRNKFGRGVNATVGVSAVVAPSVEISNKTAIVVEGGGLVLTCNPSGKPPPSLTWTKLGYSEVLSDTSSLTIVNVSRPGTPDNMIQYQCTATNGVERPATATVNVTVHYAPSVSDPVNETVRKTPGQDANFKCLGMGNPVPTVNWESPDNNIKWISNLTNVTFNTEPSSSGFYLCTVTNELGKAVKRYQLVMEALKILIKVTITNKNCENNPLEICENTRKKVTEIIKGDDRFKEKLEAVTEENCGCGSVTAYLSLDFKQSVEIPKVLSVLKRAAEGNGFGDLQVDLGSIQAISDDQLPSSTQGPSSTAETTTSGDDGNKERWIIIGASAGGVIVLVIIIVVVAWCVHHKRKCRRKGSKVRCCSESEEQAFTPREDNDHGHVNNGYAEAGPRPTAMVDMSQHQGASVAPTYAVVDKSAKKGKMKDKKDEEKKPQTEPPQYSVVDKSKKKKKKKEEEPEATYAQVNMSKKSKKKAKPGEVLYADLGDFHQMQELPNVSTSPKALPPIKKPAPYVETQYADITQFLKGDVTLPDSNNSQGPAPGTQPAPVPENQESQEPGTSAKETSQASNPGGVAGPGHETNF